MKDLKRIQVSANDVKQLAHLADFIDSDLYTEPERFLEKIVVRWNGLRLSFIEDLHKFREDTNSIALLISGLPIELQSEILTPTYRNDKAPKPSFISEAILTGLIGYLGEPFCFVEENLGHLVQNIFPIKEHANLQISSNAVELTLHMDAAYHPSAPDYTALLCLRNRASQKVETYYSSMLMAVKLLDNVEREMLKQELFVIEMELSHGGSGNASVPAWSQKQGRDVFRFDSSLMYGIDQESQRVVKKLSNILFSLKRTVHLIVGDLLILKNLECVHGRSPFEPQYDGLDRWLQRVYVTRDIEGLVRRVGYRQVSTKCLSSESS